jgi:ABC-type glycerol-3-phosphate transport system substrate-binding protein
VTLHSRSSMLTLAAMMLASTLGLSLPAAAQQKEVRWGQWKGTEVGEKFMAEVTAAFEKDHPEIKLVAVDSPFTGFHDRAIVQQQAKKLPDVLMIQVDWVAEFADLGLIEPLDERITKEPKEFFDNILPPSIRSGAGSSTTCRSRAARSPSSTTPISSKPQRSAARRRLGTNSRRPPASSPIPRRSSSR